MNHQLYQIVMIAQNSLIHTCYRSLSTIAPSRSSILHQYPHRADLFKSLLIGQTDTSIFRSPKKNVSDAFVINSPAVPCMA